AAELIGDVELALTVIHPGDLKVVTDAMLGGDPGAPTYPYTVRWLRRDGGVTWAEQHVEPIRDDAGVVVALEGIARDVTPRIEAERELALTEAQLQRLTERASDVIYRYR